MRQELVGTLNRLNFVDLGSADGGVENFHQHLSDVEFVRKNDVVDDKGPARFGEHRGFSTLNLHVVSARHSK